MKNSLIRILTIMTLATSISAFGASDKPADGKKANSDKANCEATTTSSKTDRSEAQSDESKEKSERQRLIKEQEKQWLHDVQNIVAG